MANNIIEDFIKNKRLQQTLNVQIIGQYYNNLKLFKESEEFEHLFLLNKLGQKNNLNLKSKEILDLTLKKFIKDYDYSLVEKEFKNGSIGLQWFTGQTTVVCPHVQKKFRDHMRRYLNRQLWITNLSKISWTVL